MTRRVLSASTGAIVAAVVALGAASASGATIGSDLGPAPPPFMGYSCGVTPCSLQQLRIPGNPNPMAAPFDGVIRKWRYRSGSTQTYAVRVRVVRRARTGRWRFIRSSGYRTIGPEPGVNAFSARLRVREGDRIAIDLPSDVDISQISVPLDGARANSWFPAPADGAAPAPGDSNDYEYLWNATVRR